jgi:PEP-CTERM motif-containing protein
MRVRRFLILLGTALILWPLGALADAIPVGFVSFDVTNPGSPGQPGVNTFSISNFTGASFLPPDFPVSSDLVFLAAQLVLTKSNNQKEVFLLGDITSGPPVTQNFPDSEQFTSATFSGVLNSNTFTSSSGGTFVAPSTTFSTDLNPSSGLTLIPGVDSVVIVVNAFQQTVVPEPGTIVLFSGGIVGLWLWNRKSDRPK